jgi:hypothetical protein
MKSFAVLPYFSIYSDLPGQIKTVPVGDFARQRPTLILTLSSVMTQKAEQSAGPCETSL